MPAVEREIQAKEAAIQTVEITIQALRVGRKQMTIAVYRQLPNRPLIGNAGELTGVAWGWVNYDSYSRHRTYIYSYEGRLYRNTVNMSKNIRVKEDIETVEEKEHYVNEATGEKREYYQHLNSLDWKSRAAWKHVASKRVRKSCGTWRIEFVDGEWDYSAQPYDPESDWVWNSETAAQRYRASRLESINQLLTLEQLFIAV